MSSDENKVEMSSDSSSDNDSNETEDDMDNSREKRETIWCGVENTNSSPTARKIVWPPPLHHQQPSTSYFNSTNWGNPKLGSKMQLFSSTGYFLSVYPDGIVKGTTDETDPHTFLEIVTGGSLPQHIKIKGMLTNMYVAMNKKGRLYAETNPDAESTVFIESFQGSYNIYLSEHYAHMGWYIGIKKSGKFKNGARTKYGQKAIKFLPIRKRFENNCQWARLNSR